MSTSRFLGALAVVATGAVHLYLYAADDFRAIPTIGTLFLLNAVAGFVLGAALLVIRSPLAPVAGIGFALATLVAFVISAVHGLFGWQDVEWTGTWQLAAGLSEVAAVALLGASLPFRAHEATPAADRRPSRAARTHT